MMPANSRETCICYIRAVKRVLKHRRVPFSFEKLGKNSPGTKTVGISVLCDAILYITFHEDMLLLKWNDDSFVKNDRNVPLSRQLLL